LQILAWGAKPKYFEYFERPDDDTIEATLALLDRLGLIAKGSLTPMGKQAEKLSLHPRLARMLLEAGGSEQMARACAILSERHFLPPHAATTTSDLLSALDRWIDVPPHVQRAADQIVKSLKSTNQSAIAHPKSKMERGEDAEAAFRRAL